MLVNLKRYDIYKLASRDVAKSLSSLSFLSFFVLYKAIYTAKYKIAFPIFIKRKFNSIDFLNELFTCSTACVFVANNFSSCVWKEHMYDLEHAVWLCS